MRIKPPIIAPVIVSPYRNFMDSIIAYSISLRGLPPACRLARSRHALVVLRPKLTRRGASAFVSKDRSRPLGRYTLLLNEIVGQGQRRAKILPARGRAILGKIGDCLKGQIGIKSRRASSESAVRRHTSTVRRRAERNRSLSSFKGTFQTLLRFFVISQLFARRERFRC
jgi:hypothetical protein